MTIRDRTQDIIHKPSSGDYERLDEFLNDLLASPTFEEIKFADNTGIKDDSGNEQLIFQKTAAAINHLEITNAAIGGRPKLSAAGDDTNITVEFETKGTGNFRFNSTPANSGNGAEFNFGSASYPVLRIVNTSETDGGSVIHIEQNSANPAAADFPGGIVFAARDSAANKTFYAQVWGQILDTTNGSEDGSLDLYGMVGGAQVEVARFSAGMVVGVPTNGFKGAGTANFAGDIYKNDTAYTNPDYVLELEYTGKIERFAENEGAKDYQGHLSIDELDKHMREHLRLPGISDSPMGAFERSDKALEKLEEMALYIVELHRRIERLEASE